MLGRSELVAFIGATGFARARQFYEDVLGLTLREVQEPFALVFDANGVTLRVTKVPEVAPPAYTVLGWRVDDIDATIAELAAKGVTFERYPGLPQDALGAWTSPGGARIAWFRDPDGNLLSISSA